METLLTELDAALGAHFRVERELAPGGMSRVFIAVDETLNRRVAVKVFHPSALTSQSAERFLWEIQVSAALQHPNIVPVLSTGKVNGQPYFVMPFLDGISLRARLQRMEQIPLGEAIAILRDIARALTYAHDSGIVHRDIKPDNVMLCGGAAVVLDFGVARASANASDALQGASHTRTGMSVGTPAYMAPEQIAADPTTDARADIYAFGVMAYEMLTGAHPFALRTPQEVLVAHLSEVPVSLAASAHGIPPTLSAIIERCLLKDRDERWQSAGLLLEQLDGLSSGIMSAKPKVRSVDLPRRRRWLAMVGLVLATSTLFAWSRRTIKAPTNTTTRSPNRHALLVMPFEVIGADTAAAYLSEALASELAAAATKTSGLRVSAMSARTAATLRIVDDSARAVASATSLLLRGTIRRQGSRVRVVVTLTSPFERTTLWADTFDSELADAFGLQEKIASATGLALVRAAGGASSGADAVIGTRGTRSATAYDLFLRARFLFQRRGASSLLRAALLAGEAVKADSSFARAHALLAQIRSVTPLYEGAADALFDAALESASKAIALDSSLGIAFAARANLLSSKYRWTAAERDYRRAIVLQPDDAQSHAWLGEHLLVRGFVAEAVRELARAAELDPLSPVIQASYGLALAVNGNLAEGRRLAQRAIELDSALFVGHLMLGAVELFAGDDASALDRLITADRLAPQSSLILGLLGAAHAGVGHAGEVIRLLDVLDRDPNPNALIAVAHIRLGQGDAPRALDALEAALRGRAPQFAFESMMEPMFDMLRGEPRFARLVTSLGLGEPLLKRGNQR